MRRRITGNLCTGLGNPSPVIFDNEWTGNKKFNDAVKLFFEDVLNSINDEFINDIGGFDFKIELENNSFRILFGMEPSYMYDPYICYCFDSKKRRVICIRGSQVDIMVLILKSNQRRVIRDVVKNLENV